MDFNPSLCCGCAACYHVCPTGAIEWVENDRGFRQPRISQAKCVNCGLCRKVCPYETTHAGVDAEPEIYAAVHKDPAVVKASSSGGSFTALSDAVFAMGGVVYGVAFDKDYRLTYQRTESAAQRNALRGSKYVQCDGSDVFPKVQQDLSDGLVVLFTGTPCQVSGLKAWLAVKKTDTSLLYTIDNVCHGAASHRVWERYLDYIRKSVLKSGEIKLFSMRSKETAWQKQEVLCRTYAGDESGILNRTASWNRLYQTTFATRESCFHCRFTSFDRVGDITLADYWNIENAGLKLDYSGGVNLLLVNTDKGRALLEQCRDALILEPSDKTSCWQIHLERPGVASGKQKDFWAVFARDPDAAVAKAAKGSAFIALARAVSPVLRRLGVYTFAVRLLTVVKGHGAE